MHQQATVRHREREYPAKAHRRPTPAAASPARPAAAARWAWRLVSHARQLPCRLSCPPPAPARQQPAGHTRTVPAPAAGALPARPHRCPPKNAPAGRSPQRASHQPASRRPATEPEGPWHPSSPLRARLCQARRHPAHRWPGPAPSHAVRFLPTPRRRPSPAPGHLRGVRWPGATGPSGPAAAGPKATRHRPDHHPDHRPDAPRPRAPCQQKARPAATVPPAPARPRPTETRTVPSGTPPGAAADAGADWPTRPAFPRSRRADGPD